MSEKEKERHSHINYGRSDQNKYLVQKDLKELYQNEFGEALEPNKNVMTEKLSYYKYIQASKKLRSSKN